MVIGLKMAALSDGTDPPPHSPLFPTEGLNQECGFRQCPPPPASSRRTSRIASLRSRHLSFAP